MCAGRVDLAFILRAFSNGSDGVFIGGCHLGECRYVTNGNYAALNMVQLCRKLLGQIGVSPERLRLEWLSSGEGIRFAEVINDFSRQLRRLGPLGKGEGIDEKELRSRLETVTRRIPYIKLVKREKLALRLNREEDYDEIYSGDEVGRLFREVISYHIDPDRCRACMVCLRKCPVEAITGGKNRIHAIDQEKCIKCGTCFEACPPHLGAVKKI